MPCVHGLDENNCPICRINQFSLPVEVEPLADFENALKPVSAFFQKERKKSEEFINELKSNFKRMHTSHPKITAEPKYLNNIPNFQNFMFLERLKEIDVSKADVFGISKKINLEDPEWQINQED